MSNCSTLREENVHSEGVESVKYVHYFSPDFRAVTLICEFVHESEHIHTQSDSLLLIRNVVNLFKTSDMENSAHNSQHSNTHTHIFILLGPIQNEFTLLK